MSAIESLIGRSGEPAACREIDGMSVHWWRWGAAPGDLCMCGKPPYQPRDYEFDDEPPVGHPEGTTQ